MSSSTIRKAIGVVKDQTSISIAKVAGNVAPDLEVLIVKATGHDTEPAEEKYIREILHLITHSRGYVSACVYNISKRLSKTHDWVVALKALMLIHRLLVDGDPVFGQEIMCASRKGTRVLNMSDFRVEALSNYWDHSGFVKTYASYLNQKLEFIAFERKLIGYREMETSHGIISQKSKSYGDLYESVTRNDRKDIKIVIPLKEMKHDRVLERLSKLVRLLDRVLACRPTGSAKNSRMVLVALYLVLKESFRIYADICEALGVLFDRFEEMEYINCVRTFDEYVKASKIIDEVMDFYTWCKELGVARGSEFPEVQKITDKVLGTLESFLREKKSIIEKNCNHSPEDNALVPVTAVESAGDLVDLKDESGATVSMKADEHGHTLALALFSGQTTVDTQGPTRASCGWQTMALDGGKSDWELALVESASNLSNQTINNKIGLDPMMLNEIYDHGSVTQPVLAVPAQENAVPAIDPQDPFAASLAVPPPPYVQLADMEKKKSFLVQEQVWQQYGGNDGGVAAVSYKGMGQQAGYNYARY